MLYSMTGFARHTQSSHCGQLVIEIRSINHRYLESSFRCPDHLKSLEAVLKEKLSQHISRGKIEVQIRLNNDSNSSANLLLNEVLVQEYVDIHQRISTMIKSDKNLSAIEIMRLPNILMQPEVNIDEIKIILLDLFTKTLNDLAHNRAAEGEKIAVMISTRIHAMRQLIKEAQIIRPEAVRKQREKIVAKLQELDVENNPQRLEQEIVFYTQRLDIDEEIDRLNAHLSEMEAALLRKEPIGRRLDFITQELNREANTLSSKSQDLNLTKVGIELKVIIEQIREQIQNIE